MMKVLKMFWYKLRSRLYIYFYTRNHRIAEIIAGDTNTGGISSINEGFEKMVMIRTAEVLEGPVENIADGDSIIHGGEPYIEAKIGIKSFRVKAIGGDNVDTNRARVKLNVLSCQPKRVALHLTGNDFLGSKTLEYVFLNFTELVKEHHKAGVDLAWIETLPLGYPEKSIVEAIRKNADMVRRLNLEVIPEFIRMVEKSGLVEIIRVRHMLIKPDGFIREEYGAPDCIHVMPAAYEKVYTPVLRDWFLSQGAQAA